MKDQCQKERLFLHRACYRSEFRNAISECCRGGFDFAFSCEAAEADADRALRVLDCQALSEQDVRGSLVSVEQAEPDERARRSCNRRMSARALTPRKRTLTVCGRALSCRVLSTVPSVSES